MNFGLGGKSTGGKMLNFFLVLILAGLVGGIWGCHLWGDTPEHPCNKVKTYLIWAAFIVGIFVLGLTGKSTFSIDRMGF